MVNDLRILHLIILGCPDGFVSYDNKCYWFETDKKAWTEARMYCRNVFDGFHLVVINDSQENQFLQHYIKTHFANQEFSIGLKENGNVKEYSWVDESLLEFGKELERYPWYPDNGTNDVSIPIKMYILQNILNFCNSS